MQSVDLTLPTPACVPGLGGPGTLSRGEMGLAEVQCHLDKEGASDLVIDLIMNATSDRVFQESILLAIALLEGGNTTIQVLHPTDTPPYRYTTIQVHHPTETPPYRYTTL